MKKAVARFGVRNAECGGSIGDVTKGCRSPHTVTGDSSNSADFPTSCLAEGERTEVYGGFLDSSVSRFPIDCKG